MAWFPSYEGILKFERSIFSTEKWKIIFTRSREAKYFSIFMFLIAVAVNLSIGKIHQTQESCASIDISKGIYSS